MAKILRLHRTGSNTKLGWDRTGKIGHNEIDGPVGILDPDGARASQVAVALPSPFARMHLEAIRIGDWFHPKRQLYHVIRAQAN